MFIVIGLGNPGFEYERTRHNAGFIFLDTLRNQLSAPAFSLQKNLASELSKFDPYLLIKPTTFMNDSGRAARAVVDYYKDVQQGFPTNTIVAYDDLDLEFGTFQLRQDTGPKVHNGVSSVTQYLKTNAFWHLRIGVDSRAGDRSMPGSNYVLQKFSLEEHQKLNHLFISEVIPHFLARFPR